MTTLKELEKTRIAHILSCVKNVLGTFVSKLDDTLDINKHKNGLHYIKDKTGYQLVKLDTLFQRGNEKITIGYIVSDAKFSYYHVESAINKYANDNNFVVGKILIEETYSNTSIEVEFYLN